MPVRKTLLYFGLLLIACFSMGDAATPVVDSGLEVQQAVCSGSEDGPDTFDPDLEASFSGFHSQTLIQLGGRTSSVFVPRAYGSQHASPRPIRAPPVTA